MTDGPLAGIDDELEHDDDDAGDAGRTGADELGDVEVCPDCGEEFTGRWRFARIANHRRSKHGWVKPPKERGTKDGGSPRKPGRPKKDASPVRPGSRSQRRQRIAQTITRAVDLYENRGAEAAESIAATIRRDADKIAGFLAAVADNFNPLGALVDKTLGDGGIVDGLLSLGGLLRAIFNRLEAGSSERARLQELFNQRFAEIRERDGVEAAEEYARKIQAGELVLE